MADIYYFFGLIIFLLNINIITNFFGYIKIKEWFKSYQKITKKTPSTDKFKKGELDKLKNYSSLMNLNFVWLFFGLITTNWKFLILTLTLNSVLGLVTHFIGEFRTISKILSLLNLILICSVILVTSMNHFHYQKDLFNILTSCLPK